MFSKNKINIYDYSDYRKFLQEFYELEKSLDPTFSYRVFATAVNMDASLLVKILQGKRHVSRKCIETFVQFFRFKEAKAEYFREMVAYGKAKNDEQVRKHFETLQKMRPAACRELDEARYRYFQQWFYPMIRSALDVFDYRGPQDAAKLGESSVPKLTATQVQAAVDALLQLGLAHTRKDGRVVPTEAHLKTKEHWLSACISDYQASIAELARKSITDTPKEKSIITAPPARKGTSATWARRPPVTSWTTGSASTTAAGGANTAEISGCMTEATAASTRRTARWRSFTTIRRWAIKCRSLYMTDIIRCRSFITRST